MWLVTIVELTNAKMQGIDFDLASRWLDNVVLFI